MPDSFRISDTELLYDPLFDKKPDVEMKGKKNTVFKLLFIIIIAVFVIFPSILLPLYSYYKYKIFFV